MVEEQVRSLNGLHELLYAYSAKFCRGPRLDTRIDVAAESSAGIITAFSKLVKRDSNLVCLHVDAHVYHDCSSIGFCLPRAR